MLLRRSQQRHVRETWCLSRFEHNLVFWTSVHGMVARLSSVRHSQAQKAPFPDASFFGHVRADFSGPNFSRHYFVCSRAMIGHVAIPHFLVNETLPSGIPNYLDPATAIEKPSLSSIFGLSA